MHPTNGVTCAVNTNAPFGLALNTLGAGTHTLRALATDDQSLSATSAPVNVRVVVPPVVHFEQDGLGTRQSFFQTVTGVNYVIESAANLPDFTAQATNAGSGTVQNFFSGISAGRRYFRLRLE